jgi:hypothetical protein
MTIQLVSMFWRTPSFQSAARTPPISKANPRKYIPAHFMAHLLLKVQVRRKEHADLG